MSKFSIAMISGLWIAAISCKPQGMPKTEGSSSKNSGSASSISSSDTFVGACEQNATSTVAGISMRACSESYNDAATAQRLCQLGNSIAQIPSMNSYMSGGNVWKPGMRCVDQAATLKCLAAQGNLKTVTFTYLGGPTTCATGTPTN